VKERIKKEVSVTAKFNVSIPLNFTFLNIFDSVSEREEKGGRYFFERRTCPVLSTSSPKPPVRKRVSFNVRKEERMEEPFQRRERERGRAREGEREGGEQQRREIS